MNEALRAVRDAAGVRPFRGPLKFAPPELRDAIVSGLLDLDILVLNPETSDMSGYETSMLCDFALRRARAIRRQAGRGGDAQVMVMPLVSAPPVDHEPEPEGWIARAVRWLGLR